MYIISLYQNSSPVYAEEKVLNIIYGEDSEYIKNWINLYCINEIDSLIMSPPLYNTHSINYIIENNENVFNLIKKYKQSKEGYIYNSYKKVSEIIYSIKYNYFDEHKEFENESVLNKIANLYLEDTHTKLSFIQKEICHRIMRNLNKDELFEVIINFETTLRTKNIWNNKELQLLQNETIKKYRKTMYNNISRRLKKKEKEINQTNTNNELNIKNSLPITCKLEWEILNGMKEKFD